MLTLNGGPFGCCGSSRRRFLSNARLLRVSLATSTTFLRVLNSTATFIQQRMMPAKGKYGLFDQTGLFSDKLGNFVEVCSGLPSHRLHRVNLCLHWARHSSQSAVPLKFKCCVQNVHSSTVIYHHSPAKI